MPEAPKRLAKETEMLESVGGKGPLATLGIYMKLSGPGWLQSAITLGGGSLGSSLFLGVMAGFGMMWLQPVAMLMGVIMLSAIAYVTLATGERPFDAIRKHVNPALAWAWAIATLMANMVWAMPQFSLATGALEQNLLPGMVDGDGAKWAVGIGLLVICTAIIWSYDKGGKGVAVFELILKIIVGLIVLSFVGVVVALSMQGAISWGAIFSGLVPDFSLLSKPADTYSPYLDVLGQSKGYWTDHIVSTQKNIMIAAVATAVGINMTFLLPYSMLKKGWNAKFRGLAIFDLSTGLFIPYVVATGCVVIAAAAQFHPSDSAHFKQIEAGLDQQIAYIDRAEQMSDDAGAKFLVAKGVSSKFVKGYRQNLKGYWDKTHMAVSAGDKKIAALLIKRDTGALAKSLEPFLGETVAQEIFGFGVLAMAFSTAIILMLINGFVVCEMLGFKDNAKWHRIGCVAAGITGLLGARLIWGGANTAWLVMPTSTIGMILLPVAYITFFFMMNSRGLLGDKMPRGLNRVVWNSLMGVATAFASYAAMMSIEGKTKMLGQTNWQEKDIAYAMVGLFVLSVVVAQVIKCKKSKG